MSESVDEKMGNTHPPTNSSTHSLTTHPLTNSSTHLPNNTPIIQVKHLSKRYQIGMDRTYKTFCETAIDTLKSPLKRLKSFSRQEETFWALKDINFEVNRGEVVGIIGKNGAGKSTLLKILSRITHPTEGEVILRGRMGSLLEVGTGFHPELTGRENVYFNGAILGMTKQEIEEKFEEIVKFAEIEKFLDTPVKRYSSGMYVRLAFAVAAHMDPEILAVDEVLSVGDAAFREKCLNKMGAVSQEGRTVLYVSHFMKQIELLCDRVILLNDGKKILDGDPSEVISFYLGENRNGAPDAKSADICFPNDPNKPAQINRLRIYDNQGQLSTKHNILNPIKIVVDFDLRTNFPTLFLQCVFHRIRSEDLGGGESFLTQSGDWENYEKGGNKMFSVFPMQAGKYSATLHLTAPLLNVGIYEVELYLTTGPHRQDTCRNIFFEIFDSGSFASVVRHGNRGGFLAYPLKWDIKQL